MMTRRVSRASILLTVLPLVHTFVLQSRQHIPAKILLKERMIETKEQFSDQSSFWEQQRALVRQMEDKEARTVAKNALEKYRSRRIALLGETIYISAMIFFILWACFSNPFVALSYSFGASLGIAYCYGLGKYVETIGGSVQDGEDVRGAGVGQARFAFLILLILFVGKFRSQGLLEIPSISGFFTYQLASLAQGLREIDD